MATVELMVNGSAGDANGNPGLWQPPDPNYVGDPPPAVDWTLAADNSDSTYIYQGGPHGGGSRFFFQDYAIPANAQVRSVTIKVRANKATGPTPSELHSFLGSVGTILEQKHVWMLDRTIQDHLSPVRVDPNSGRKWLQEEVNGITVVISSSPEDEDFAEGARIYRLSALLDVNHQPTIAVTGPGPLPVTGTSKPTITFTYSDPEGNAMERRKIRVFSQAQYQAAGFDPAKSIAFVELLEHFSTSLSWQVPKYLPNGSWRAYVVAADAGSNGRYSLFGPHTEWSQAVPTPTAPVIATVTPDTALNRIQLVVTSTDTVNTTHIILERDDGDGFQRVLKAPETGATTTLTDYTAARGAAVTYRAIAVLDDGTSYAESSPSATASTTLNSDGFSWLKSTTDSGLNIKVQISTQEVESTSSEDVEFHEAMGRADPIPVAGTIRLEEFSGLPIFFKNRADYLAFERLRKRRETLLLQIGAGEGRRDQWFIRLTEDRRVVTTGEAINDGKPRMVTVAAREVRRPSI